MFVRAPLPLRKPRRPAGWGAVLGALLAVVLPAVAAEARATKPAYPDEFAREGRSKTLCESDAGRVFVRHRRGTACIAFLVTDGHEQKRHAVLFFDGDVPLERFSDFPGAAARLAQARSALQALSDKARLRIIRVSRLGLDGSSGNHGQRHRPDEVLAMHAAVDALKARFGLETVTLAGQSRGAMIVAALLTFGRTDVTCAALGSGVYEHAEFIHRATLRVGTRVSLREIQRIVYDPSEHVAAIRHDPGRRIFVIGDPQDQRTPFIQQQRFATAVAQAGHHVQVLPILAGDDLHHGSTAYALNAAARCALGQTDEQIAKGADRIRKAVASELQRKALAKAHAGERPVTETGALRQNPLGASSRQAP